MDPVFWTGPGGGTCTFDVLRQDLPGAGVLDTVSTPGGEELDQPGRRGVGDGALQAAAAQEDQRVLLRVQAGGGTDAAVSQPQDGRYFQPEPEHPRRRAEERRRTHAGGARSFQRGTAGDEAAERAAAVG